MQNCDYNDIVLVILVSFVCNKSYDVNFVLLLFDFIFNYDIGKKFKNSIQYNVNSTCKIKGQF